MFSRLEWMIAGRYMRARRKEGAISVITGFSLVGILLGVGTLIVVMSVMNGFRAELIKQIIGAQPHISVYGSGQSGVFEYDDLSNQLNAIPGVKRAAPRMEQTVMASGKNDATGVQLRGLRMEDLNNLPGVSDPEWSVGNLEDVENGIAIGEGVARKLGVQIGDKVMLMTPPNRVVAFGKIPTRRHYTVTYIFRVGYYPYDNAMVFLPLKEAQGLLNKRDRVDGIEVFVDDPDALSRNNDDPVSRAIIARGGAAHFPWNWLQSNGTFIDALDTERAAMFVILSLVILVAALNIISGLIMLVKEKGQNIGIMRTFGMTRGGILRVFFICGASIGVIGTILGVIGGVLFVTFIHDIQAFLEAILGIPLWPVEVRGLSEIPAVMHMSDVITTAVVALVLSLLATWYPARRAARMDPIEALRYE